MTMSGGACAVNRRAVRPPSVGRRRSTSHCARTTAHRHYTLSFRRNRCHAALKLRSVRRTTLSLGADISRSQLIGRTLALDERAIVIPDRADAESELSVAHPWWQFSVRFNVAVSQSIPVVRMHERESRA